MGNVDEQKKETEGLISKQDLLNIGLSRHYVTTILDRIKEYNKKKNETTKS